MITTLRWIGSLPQALQVGLDRAVSAELHAITSDICRSKTRLRWAVNGVAPASGCDPIEAEAISAAPEQIAA